MRQLHWFRARSKIGRCPVTNSATSVRLLSALSKLASFSLPGAAHAGLPLASFTSGGFVDYTVGGAFQELWLH